MQIKQFSQQLNTQSIRNQKTYQQNVNFKSAPVAKTGIYNAATDKIAVGLTHVFKLDFVSKFIEKHKDDKSLIKNLTVLNSFVLSGFYMLQTLKNDNLDDHKRKTLAVNQGIVFALSTLGGFATDNWIKTKVDKFADKYSAVHANEEKEIAKKLFHGVKAAQPMIVFGLIYRFITPVFVTPVANYFGKKIDDKKAQNK